MVHCVRGPSVGNGDVSTSLRSQPECHAREKWEFLPTTCSNVRRKLGSRARPWLCLSLRDNWSADSAQAEAAKKCGIPRLMPLRPLVSRLRLAGSPIVENPLAAPAEHKLRMTRKRVGLVPRIPFPNSRAAFGLRKGGEHCVHLAAAFRDPVPLGAGPTLQMGAAGGRVPLPTYPNPVNPRDQTT